MRLLRTRWRVCVCAAPWLLREALTRSLQTRQLRKCDSAPALPLDHVPTVGSRAEHKAWICHNEGVIAQLLQPFKRLAVECGAQRLVREETSAVRIGALDGMHAVGQRCRHVATQADGAHGVVATVGLHNGGNRHGARHGVHVGGGGGAGGGGVGGIVGVGGKHASGFGRDDVVGGGDGEHLLELVKADFTRVDLACHSVVEVQNRQSDGVVGVGADDVVRVSNDGVVCDPITHLRAASALDGDLVVDVKHAARPLLLLSHPSEQFGGHGATKGAHCQMHCAALAFPFNCPLTVQHNNFPRHDVGTHFVEVRLDLASKGIRVHLLQFGQT
mmetsp:Transcript_16307/g.34985  ORF Transcript_16307/g.34985 Transcript_16307/m.34985 type:complete len:330 (-) Transcript_16307:1155-2144(-)